MFLIKTSEFIIREFNSSDFDKLFFIAQEINKQANEKEGFKPFYAFQVDVNRKDYLNILAEKTKAFLKKAYLERMQENRKTYRLALCDSKGDLVGNITIDDIPSIDENGKKIQGDLGYFINPKDGRKGLMSKALFEVLSLYFKTHDELDVTLHPNNLYSIKMMQRFNAKVVSFKSSSVYQNEPRIVLKILKRDFLNLRKSQFIGRKKITLISREKERIRDV
ncbi:MAG: GNAT family N-acetyltransferase [Alphaproteobacteria bacterium]|nr:GNAT family N-acetyltransferase [Alphaproteobacteria bacterium]